MSIVTFTTDFGTVDGYVGAMKGVVLSLAQDATTVDITHDIPRHDIAAGAFALAQAAPLFPPGTVHVAVVDPGVGGRGPTSWSRRAAPIFVGPDNGLLALAARGPRVAHGIERPEFRREPVSPTFHGRDVFAQTAGLLAAGHAAARGRPAAAGHPGAVCPRPADSARRRGSAAVVVHVDAFGNLITSLARRLARAGQLAGAGALAGRAAARSARPDGPTRTCEPGELVAYVGSAGLIEIAVREGSAAAVTGLARGATTCGWKGDAMSADCPARPSWRSGSRSLGGCTVGDGDGRGRRAPCTSRAARGERRLRLRRPAPLLTTCGRISSPASRSRTSKKTATRNRIVIRLQDSGKSIEPNDLPAVRHRQQLPGRPCLRGMGAARPRRSAPSATGRPDRPGPACASGPTCRSGPRWPCARPVPTRPLVGTARDGDGARIDPVVPLPPDSGAPGSSLSEFGSATAARRCCPTSRSSSTNGSPAESFHVDLIDDRVIEAERRREPPPDAGPDRRARRQLRLRARARAGRPDLSVTAGRARSPSTQPAPRAPCPSTRCCRRSWQALRASRALVVEAPPGAGKTTRVPLALLEAGLAEEGEVLVLQPRRLPARLVAEHIAAELGERARAERWATPCASRTSRGPRTRLRFITEGLLTRRLLADPTLAGRGRGGAGRVPRAPPRHRPGAGAAAPGCSARRPGAAPAGHVRHARGRAGARVPGRLPGRALRRAACFPIEIEHLRRRRRAARWPTRWRARSGALPARGDADGDVLVFLPGAGEIRRCGRGAGADRRAATICWCCRCTAICRRTSRPARSSPPPAARSSSRPTWPRPR